MLSKQTDIFTRVIFIYGQFMDFSASTTIFSGNAKRRCFSTILKLKCLKDLYLITGKSYKNHDLLRLLRRNDLKISVTEKFIRMGFTRYI